nr:nonaspanin [Tanacetum cinerariifolium]
MMCQSIIGNENKKDNCETYQYYDLMFCHPGQVIPKKETLGEVLNGDRLTNTVYELRFREDEVEQVLCNKKLKIDDITKFRDAVMNDFYFQMKSSHFTNGAFMLKGEILIGIGRNGNNHIYPMAWAVVIIEAITNVMPYAEKKQCERHIYEGFRKHFSRKMPGRPKKKRIRAKGEGDISTRVSRGNQNVAAAGSGIVGDVGEARGMQTNKRKVGSSLGKTKRKTKKRGCNSAFAKWFEDGL